MAKWTVTYGRGRTGQQVIEADKITLTGNQGQWMDFVNDRRGGGTELVHRIAAEAVHEVVRADEDGD